MDIDWLLFLNFFIIVQLNWTLGTWFDLSSFTAPVDVDRDFPIFLQCVFWVIYLKWIHYWYTLIFRLFEFKLLSVNGGVKTHALTSYWGPSDFMNSSSATCILSLFFWVTCFYWSSLQVANNVCFPAMPAFWHSGSCYPSSGSYSLFVKSRPIMVKFICWNIIFFL